MVEKFAMRNEKALAANERPLLPSTHGTETGGSMGILPLPNPISSVFKGQLVVSTQASAGVVECCRHPKSARPSDPDTHREPMRFRGQGGLP
jgi:hypothetical protein